MPLGPITAVRVFQNIKTLLVYVSGKENRAWFEEQLTSINAPELTKMVSDLDRQAAVDQTAQLRQEHTDLYCIQRDLFYGTRSRKWLYTRAMQSRIDQNYQVWVSFIRQNMDIDLDSLRTADPDILAGKPAAALLEIKKPI